MTLTVNGVNLLPYVAAKGYQWQRNDVDGPLTGRALEDAYLYRDRVAIKIRLDITCRPLTTEEVKIVLQAIKPEYVTVTYTDPQEGGDVTAEMYSNNIPASHAFHRPDGTDVWMGITFPLIQR